MASADDVLAVAISQLGYQEGANNNTKYGQWYGMNNVPWCDEFVSWVAAQAGAADIIGKFAYCPYHVNWFKSRNQWHTSSPQRGDIIFYDWNGDGVADHVGIVENVLDGTYPGAIEGNSTDGNTSEGLYVARHARALKYILGYGRPAYGASSAAYRPIPNITSAGTGDPTKDWFDMATKQELTDVVRGEGISGAGDRAHNGVGENTQAIHELGDVVSRGDYSLLAEQQKTNDLLTQLLAKLGS